MTEGNSCNLASSSDRYAWKVSGQSYNWPASRLTWANMRKLTKLSNYLKQPINQVLVDAVEAYAAAILTILPDSSPPLENSEIELIESGQIVWQAEAMTNQELLKQTLQVNELSHNVSILFEQIEELHIVIDALRLSLHQALNKRAIEAEQSQVTIFEVAVLPACIDTDFRTYATQCSTEKPLGCTVMPTPSSPTVPLAKSQVAKPEKGDARQPHLF